MDEKKVTYSKTCDRCGDATSFIIHNITKNESYSFCGVCFWKFCKKMGDAYDIMRTQVIPGMKDILDDI